MNRFLPAFAFIIVFTLAPLSSLHASNGKEIYNKGCQGCHGTEVFTRPDRKVKDLAQLAGRVRQCSYAIEAKWFDEEINAVTQYLNNAFYKF